MLFVKRPLKARPLDSHHIRCLFGRFFQSFVRNLLTEIFASHTRRKQEYVSLEVIMNGVIWAWQRNKLEISLGSDVLMSKWEAKGK